MNSDERQVGDEEFKELTRDEAKARMLRKVVQDLAGGEKGDPVVEMARSILSGQKGVREALSELPRTEAAEGRLFAFQDRWDAMSETERFEAEKRAREFLQQQQDEIDAERASSMKGKRSTRHSGNGWSLY